MKQMRFRFALLLCVAASAAGAQTHVRTTIEWQPQYQKFPCDSPVILQASLTPAAAGELIVGLEGAPKTAGAVEIALASVVPFAAHPTAARRVFTNLSPSIRQAAPCVFDFSAEPPAKERLALHVRVKPDTRVTLQVNGQTSASLVVTRGVVLYDGRIVIDSGALYVLRASAVGITRGFFDEGPELLRDPQGRPIITPKGFRNHLIETPELRLASRASWEGECCAGASLVTFKVAVAPDGEVVSVEPLSVPPQQAERLTRLLPGLRLKPFVQDGTGVYAEGFLTLLLDKAGRAAFLY